MSTLETLKVIIFHEDPNRRARLREILGLIAIKGVVRSVSSFRQAIKTVHDLGEVDCIFLSSSLSWEELQNLFSTIDAMQVVRRPAFLVTLSAAQQSHDIVANLSLKGVDAFLQEPFSSGEISQTLTALQGLRNKPREDEQKLASTAQFVMQSAARLIDGVSLELIQGKPGGYVLRDLRRLKPVIEELHEKMGDSLFDRVYDTFINAECTDTSKYKKTTRRKKVQHPGVTLKGIMERRGLTPQRLAASLSTDEAVILNIIGCSESITEDMAKGLAHLLGETPRFWLSLQEEYDKYREFAEQFS